MKRNKIRLSRRTLTEMVYKTVARMLAEGYDTNADGNNEFPSYDEWTDFIGNKTPVFEFHNEETDEYDNIYFDYNPNTGEIVSGSVTNAGFAPNGEVSVVVENGDFRFSLEGFYEELCDAEMKKGFEPL